MVVAVGGIRHLVRLQRRESSCIIHILYESNKIHLRSRLYIYIYINSAVYYVLYIYIYDAVYIYRVRGSCGIARVGVNSAFLLRYNRPEKARSSRVCVCGEKKRAENQEEKPPPPPYIYTYIYTIRYAPTTTTTTTTR